MKVYIIPYIIPYYESIYYILSLIINESIFMKFAFFSGCQITFHSYFFILNERHFNDSENAFSGSK